MSEAMLTAPMQTEILVVRHAEVHNPNNILYGRLPRFGLSATGQRQAQTTAQFLAGRSVAAIYTSPLLRARQTAGFLSALQPGVPVHRTKDLLEVKTGFQGESNDILKKEFTFYDPVKEPGDESMEDVWRRMRDFIERTLRRHVGETVIAVSHADPIAIMRLGLLGRPLTSKDLHAEIFPARGSVNQVTVLQSGPPRLTYFNAARDGLL